MVSMDADILIENKDCFYGEDFLDQLLSHDYKWSSLLDAADASPSEILADAAPILVPPISPVLSIKSSTSSSNSDSGSEDDSKNSSISARPSSQSPFDWIPNFSEEPASNLNLEDIELFLQKTAPKPATPNLENTQTNRTSPERNGPVMAIENGVIKGIKMEIEDLDSELNNNLSKGQTGNGYQPNSYFKVVNENTNNAPNDKQIVVNGQIQMIVEQKKVPSILKRNSNVVIKPPSIMIPAESMKGGKIAISPLSTKFNSADVQVKVTSPRSNTVINPKPVIPTKGATPYNIVQSHVIPPNPIDNESPKSPTINLSNFSDAEIRAIKKQQRMIKNRESACQSRQKRKEYVSAIEQELFKEKQDNIRLRLENKLLRDQLEKLGRTRKIPRLDASLLIPKKNIAVIFAMVFMVSLNWNVLGWNAKPFVGPSAPHRNTRQLLWTKENDIDIANDNISNSTYVTDCQNTTMKATDFANINQTESIRIAGELNRWIGGNTLNWTYDVPRKKRQATYLSEEKINGVLLDTYRLFNKLHLDNNLVEFPSIRTQAKTVKDKSRLRRLRRNKELDFPDNAVIDYETLYRKPIRKTVNDFNMDDMGEWNALLQALHRRDDTFYILGFGKGEHLLLPAVSHNVTRPPKMAFILPARTGNDSLLNDHVTLMQIDCSVVNTTLVKLKNDALPESLRKPTTNGASTDHGHKRENATRYYKTNDKENIDTNPLENSNISNYSNNQNVPHKEVDIGKDDLFAHYLFSKYESTKDSQLKRPHSKLSKITENEGQNNTLSLK